MTRLVTVRTVRARQGRSKARVYSLPLLGSILITLHIIIIAHVVIL